MYFNADAYYQEDRIAICICGTSHSFMFLCLARYSTQLVLEHFGWGLWWRHATNGWFEVEPLRTAGTQQQHGIQREIVWGMGG